jgi:mRNA interferase MazF
VTYKRFETVKVPFPFTDRQATKARPALVLSDATTFNTPIGHSVMAMITSATHSAWPLDVPISDLSVAGLRARSIVRMKLFTLDHRIILAPLGKLSPTDQNAVENALKALLAI